LHRGMSPLIIGNIRRYYRGPATLAANLGRN
jgi:hypothetical protein